MWVEKQKNGHYKYCDRYTDPLTGKTKKVSVTMEKKTKQAERIARELLNQKMNDQPDLLPKPMTLSELIDLYTENQHETVKPSTWFRNKEILDRILRVLGDVQLDKLTAGYIRKAFLDSGKSHTTLNEYIVRLKALIRWAYKFDYISDIRFLDKLDKFQDTPHAEKIQDKFLEREELETLLDSLHDEAWRDFTAFLALSGLRYGEAAALTRKDVDLQNRIINVDKTFDPTNDIVTTPKTFHSKRQVYMQDELYDLCKKVMYENKILYMSDLFFVKDGERINYDNYRIYVRNVALKVLGRPITPHVLRHTHASLLMEAGTDIDTISERLGHSDSKVTKEIYLHVTERLKKQRNEQIKNIKILSS